MERIAHLVILVTDTVPLLFAFCKQALDYGQAILRKRADSYYEGRGACLIPHASADTFLTEWLCGSCNIIPGAEISWCAPCNVVKSS